MTIAWQHHEDALLRKLAGQISFSQLAALMPGRSRNAIIGRAHRLRIIVPKPLVVPAAMKPKKPQVAAMQPMPVKHQTPKRTLKPKVRSVQPPEPHLVFGQVKLINLESGMCKFPIGDPFDADFGFCGEPQGDRQPYCEHHGEIAFTKPYNKRSPGWSFPK